MRSPGTQLRRPVSCVTGEKDSMASLAVSTAEIATWSQEPFVLGSIAVHRIFKFQRDAVRFADACNSLEGGDLRAVVSHWQPSSKTTTPAALSRSDLVIARPSSKSRTACHERTRPATGITDQNTPPDLVGLRPRSVGNSWQHQRRGLAATDLRNPGTSPFRAQHENSVENLGGGVFAQGPALPAGDSGETWKQTAMAEDCQKALALCDAVDENQRQPMLQIEHHQRPDPRCSGPQILGTRLRILSESEDSSECGSTVERIEQETCVDAGPGSCSPSSPSTKRRRCALEYKEALARCNAMAANKVRLGQCTRTNSKKRTCMSQEQSQDCQDWKTNEPLGNILDNHVKVFCEEVPFENGFGRRFVGATYLGVWKRYRSQSVHQRHFYEVIRQGHPCHLYFDLDCKMEEMGSTSGDLVVDRLLVEVDKELR